MFKLVTAGFLGAIGLSFLVFLLTLSAAPAMLGDGQYGMVFMLTCPVGWCAGIFTCREFLKNSFAPGSKGYDVLGLLGIGSLLLFVFGPFLIALLLYPFDSLIQRAMPSTQPAPMQTSTTRKR